MTRAANLANFADETILTVDGANDRVGIGTTTPSAQFQVGTGVSVYGNSGIVSATKFYGDGSNLTGVNASTATSSQGLTGTPDITVRNIIGVGATLSGVLTYEDVTNIDSIGIITARSGVSIADSIFHTGDTNTAIRFPAADTFTVETGGSERTRVDSSGNLIIGTTSAATNSQITLRSASPHLSLYGTPGSNTSQLNLGDTDDHDIGNISYDHSDNSMRFTANASERLRILSDGTVGTAGLSATPGTVAAGSIINANANAGFFTNGYDGKFGTASNHPVYIQVNGTSKLTIATSGNLTSTGTISDSIGPLRRLGIHAGAGVNFSLTAGHAGYLSRATASGITVTVPLDFATAGDMFSVFNVSTGNISIAPAGGVTMYNTADGTTVTRTLAAKGLVTILCSGTNEFLISGTGLS